MTKTRVMIVGEEETSRKLLKGGLEREGFEVVACTGAADAETRFKAAPVGVLVTDAAMTGKDGFALMEWVKTRDPRCRVILLAARAEKEVAIRALKWGAADYFEKPVDTAALVHAVRRCAEERQAEHNALVPLEGGLAILSGHLDFDLSTLPLDTIMAHRTEPKLQRMQTRYRTLTGELLTLEQVSRNHGQSVGLPQFIGTAASIADQMEAFIDHVGGDGFMRQGHFIQNGFEVSLIDVSREALDKAAGSI